MKKKYLIGGSLLALGIIPNKWLLAYCLAADGSIDNVGFVFLIFVWNIIFTGAGLWLFFRPSQKVLGDFINIGVLCFSILIALSLSEIFLRTASISIPGSRQLRIFKSSPNGQEHRLKSNLSVMARVRERKIQIRTNSHGMRWSEVSVAKPPDKKRIAFLGDSHAFGMWADSSRQSFVGVFDTLLNEDNYQVLNFGVPGYGLIESKLLLKKMVLKFNPKYVFLIFYPGNDIVDTYFGLKRYSVSNGKLIFNRDIIYSKVYENPKYAGPVPGFLQPLKNSIQSLEIYKLIEGAKSVITHSERNQNNSFIDELQVESFFNGVGYWNRKKYTPLGRDALEINLKELEMIRKICERNGVELVIVNMPWKEQIFVKQEENSEYSIWFPQKYIKEYAESYDVKYFDLLKPLRGYVFNNDTIPNIWVDYHMNNRGHTFAGRRLKEYFNRIKVKNEAVN